VTDAATPDELEEQAEESGYGAAEGESDDAPDQVQRTEVERARDDYEDDDAARGQALG
jgi:hypothetical protein